MAFRTPSFRNLEYDFEESDYSSSNKSSEEPIPTKESVSENISKESGKFSIKASISGKDYRQKRDKFNKALDNPEPGILVHPYYGKLKVTVGSYSLRETYDKKFKASYSINFKLASEITYPTEKESSVDKVNAAANEVSEKSVEDFEKKFSNKSVPQFVKNDSIMNVETVMDDLEGKVKELKSDSQIFAEMAYNIRSSKARAADLIESPLSLARNLQGSFSQLADIDVAAGAIFSVYSNNAPEIIQSNIIPGDTPVRVQQKNNQTAIVDLQINQSITNKSKAISKLLDNNEIASREELANLIVDVNNQIDNQMENTDNDELFQSLLKLKTEITKFSQSEVPVNNVLEYKTNGSTNTIVLTYELYESLDNEQDILSRNRIENPLLLEGNSILEVIDPNE